MAVRSIASLSLTFGLVSIPVKVYSATDAAVAIKFRLMGAGGARLRQQYVVDETLPTAEADSEAPENLPEPPPPAVRDPAERVVDLAAGRRTARVEQALPAHPAPAPALVERSEMLKGYEFEKDRFVLFSPGKLKALEEGARRTIDIVSFIPQSRVDPIYYDKAYFLAPDKRGAKPYSLLLKAMRTSGRCAIAKWAWRSKEYVVQIRPAEGGMVLQQLLYAEEVRSIDALNIDLVEVGDAELRLAAQLIDQISADTYDPAQFKDEEKARILAAVARKVAGHEVVATPVAHAPASGGQVVDLMAALRASLSAAGGAAPRRATNDATPATTTAPAPAPTAVSPTERKPVKRAAKSGAAEKQARTANR